MAEAVGSDKDELKLRLARAFDLAWSRYYRPGRLTVAPEWLGRRLQHILLEPKRAAPQTKVLFLQAVCCIC